MLETISSNTKHTQTEQKYFNIYHWLCKKCEIAFRYLSDLDQHLQDKVLHSPTPNKSDNEDVRAKSFQKCKGEATLKPNKKVSNNVNPWSDDRAVPGPSGNVNPWSDDRAVPGPSGNVNLWSDDRAVPGPSGNVNPWSDDRAVPGPSGNVNPWSDDRAVPGPSGNVNPWSDDRAVPGPSGNVNPWSDDRAVPGPSGNVNPWSDDRAVPGPSGNVNLWSDYTAVPGPSGNVNPWSDDRAVPGPSGINEKDTGKNYFISIKKETLPLQAQFSLQVKKRDAPQKKTERQRQAFFVKRKT